MPRKPEQSGDETLKFLESLLDKVQQKIDIKFIAKNIFHINKTNEALSIHIMGMSGKSYCRVYQYNDDKAVIYLDSLSVNFDERQKGIWKQLQELREEIGRNLGARIVCLEVKKDSWMFEWYERRGYVVSKNFDFQFSEDEIENHENVWMEKSLI